MAAINLDPPFVIPHRIEQLAGTAIGYLSIALSAAGHRAAFIFQAPKTGNIRKVGFRTGTVTTGATVDVRLETVSSTDGDGDPTGNLIGANTNASLVIGAADDNTWFTTQLTADAAVTKGDLIALVVVNPSVSPGNLNVVYIRLSTNAIESFPYADRFNATTWSKIKGFPVVSVEYDDGTYDVAPDCYPFSALTSTTYNINTVAQDEVALRFTLPFACRVTGLWAYYVPDNNTDLVIYDNSNNVIGSVSIEDNIDGADGLLRGAREYYFTQDGTNDIYLAASTVYRLAVKPTSTGNVLVHDGTVNAAAIMDSLDGGQNFYFSSRVNGGAWTDDTTRRPLFGLIIDQIDATAAAAATTTTTSTSSSTSSSSTSSTSTSSTSTSSTSTSTTSSTSSTSTSSTSTTTSTSSSTSTSSTSSTSTSTSTSSTSTSTISTSSTSTSSTTSSTSTSSTSTSSTTITETTTTYPPAPLPESTDFSAELDLTQDYQPIRMITLNHAGNFRENPILEGVHFRITLHRHTVDEEILKCWISVGTSVLTNLTARVVLAEDESVYVNVEAGVDLEASTPATLNIIHWTTTNGHVKYGVWIGEQPPNMILLNGYNALDETRPFIFRPSGDN